MTLNVSPEQSNAPATDADAAWSSDPSIERDEASRQIVVDDLLAEMTGWSSRERMGMFKRWHEGALSVVHLHVLSMLEVEGALPMSRLAEALDVSVASMTGIVDRLERRRFVERGHDSTDRRIVLVDLTETGSAVFKALAVDRRLHLARLLDQLTDDELGGLLKGIRALRSAHARIFGVQAAAGPSPSADGTVEPDAPGPESRA